MSTVAADPVTVEASGTPALELRDVCKSLRGRALLQGVSAMIQRGEIHGLLGPNGSGKTTLLRIIAGIWQQDAGQVLRHVSPDRIGYAAQHFGLYDELSVRENLIFQARMRGLALSDVLSAEQQFELSALSARRAGALSGGQRQRLQLAAALIHRPELLLLDEPTTALDAAARGSLWALLRRQSGGGTTIVLTTHELGDVEECDSATRLNEGRVVASEYSS